MTATTSDACGRNGSNCSGNSHTPMTEQQGLLSSYKTYDDEVTDESAAAVALVAIEGGSRTLYNHKNNDNYASDTLKTTTTIRRILRPIIALFLLSILTFGIGWYVPRHLMEVYIDAIIARNVPPVITIRRQQLPQTTVVGTSHTTNQDTATSTATNEVVVYLSLDPTYNHPVIDPPTISCT
jgi:hypothetical protein